MIAPSTGLLITQLWNWRAAFIAIAAVGLLALLSLFFTLPPLPAVQRENHAASHSVMKSRGAAAGFATILLVLSGHFAGLTYVRPVLQNLAMFSDGQVSFALLLFGIAGIVGSLIGSLIVSRYPAGSIAVSAALMALAVAGLVPGDHLPWLIFSAITLWGMAFGAFPVCITAWSALTFPGYAEKAGVIMAISFQVAAAAGAGTGGIIFNRLGSNMLVFMVAGLCMAGALVIIAAGGRLEAKL